MARDVNFSNYSLSFQYDDCGTVEVFLTTEQKQWFSTVKKALTKKPKRIIHRPKVSSRIDSDILCVTMYIFFPFWKSPLQIKPLYYTCKKLVMRQKLFSNYYHEELLLRAWIRHRKISEQISGAYLALLTKSEISYFSNFIGPSSTQSVMQIPRQGLNSMRSNLRSST